MGGYSGGNDTVEEFAAAAATTTILSEGCLAVSQSCPILQEILETDFENEQWKDDATWVRKTFYSTEPWYASVVEMMGFSSARSAV